MAECGADVVFRDGVALDTVGDEPKDHGRVHRVGDGEVAEEPRPAGAEALAAGAPDRLDPFHVRADGVAHCHPPPTGARVHRHGFA